MTTAPARFVVCLNNRGYAASLVVRRLYPVVADSVAEEHRMLRVVDESGEDYLYPERMFGPVDPRRASEDDSTP